MKIGLVRRGFSGTGGAEAYLARFAEALRGAGHECVLFASSEWHGQRWASGDVRVLGGSSPRSFADALLAARPREICDFLFSLERVWGCDCYRAGDGVHQAWLARRSAYEPWWKSSFRRLRPKHRELLTLERHLFSPEATRMVIANSKMVRDEIVSHFGYPSESIRVIYNGVPQGPAAESPETRWKMRAELGLRENEYVVLFAGSGWERKGLRHAILGVNAADVSNLKLLVAGRGEKRGLPASDRVRFLGAVEDMPALFSAADIFLLPTLYDPFSNACLEAMAAGLPVITTRANGFSEIVCAGEEGEVLSDPSDQELMAAAIKAWCDRERLARVRPRLRQLAARFDVEANLRSTLAEINDLALRS